MPLESIHPVNREVKWLLKSYINNMISMTDNKSYKADARYIIKETLKSLPETERLAMEAKTLACARRSTCTLSTIKT